MEIVSWNTTGQTWGYVVVLLLFFVVCGWRGWLPRGVVPVSSGYMLQRWLRRAVITVLCAILLALPFDIQVRGKKNEVSIIQPRVHILLDVSLSMSADDLQPSRFVAAKQLIQDLAYENDREASLTVFSGIPLVQIPFTADMVAFSRHLDDVRLVDFPPTQKFLGTALGDALLVSLKKASTYTDQQHIILITDGDSSIGLDPLELARVAGEQDIPVHTIAMGSEEFLLGSDKQGEEVYAYIDLSLLGTIAQYSGGTKHHIQSIDSIPVVVDALHTSIDAAPRRIVREHIYALNSILHPWLLGLLVLHFLLQTSVFVRIRALVLPRS